MNLTSIQSMRDELTKISEVSLMGISPQNLMESPQRLPMETSGFEKARQILARSEMFKTAARKPNKEDYSTGRKYIAPTLAATTGGALLGSLTSRHAPVQKHRLIGAGIGAAVGLTDAIIRHHKEHQNVK